MASFKITDLTELAAVDVADADLLEIVDFDADQSKKVSIQSLKTVFSGSPAGSDTQIQFNDGGAFGASSGFVWTGSRLGVGVSSPIGPIDALGSAFSLYQFKAPTGVTFRLSADIRHLQFDVTNTQSAIYTSASQPLILGVISSERMRISATGLFGYGQTNPQAKQHTNLSTDIVGYRLDLSNGQTADAFQINSYGNTGGDLYAIEGDGKIRSMIAAANTISQTHFNFPNAYSITNLSTLTANKYSAFFGHYTGTKHQGLYIGVNSTGAGFIQNIDGTSAYRFSIQPYGGGLTVGSTTGMPNNKTLEVNGDSYFNGNVGIGTSSPDASAITEMSSTTKGMLIPRMTTTQRDAISSPATGLLIFNTTTVKLEYYSGTAWGQV